MSKLYKGNSKVSAPCKEFVKNIENLAEQSKSLSDFMLEPGKVRDWNQGWHSKLELNPWSTSEVHDITFSRSTELDQQYDKVFNAESPGTDGDMKAIKLQAAYLQAMERAFNLRHATTIRCEAFAAGRRKGQSDPKGPLMGGVKGYIEQIIKRSQITQ
jgi:hypothetical protein